MEPTACPSVLELSAFNLGDLPEAEQDRIAAHVEACSGCESALERLEGRSRDAILDALRRPEPEPAAAPADDLPRLPGYEVLSVLGEGGMGIVYKARHVRLGRLVALKMLLTTSGKRLARFRAEAEAVARLQHPNVVQVFDVGEHQGRLYLALEFVAGGSLADRIAGKPQPPGTAADLVEVLARAVHYAHGQGVVHRDLKPANILLAISDWKSEISNLKSEIPKITDFGLARQLGSGDGHTEEGEVLGTPAYMAPEQTTGRTGEAGPASDIYSLGVVLYELLTGRTPLQGPTVHDTLRLVREAEPVPPSRLQPGVPRDLETITLKCLQKEPGRRYASALELADDLRRFRAHEPITARPPSLTYRLVKAVRRHKLLVAAVTAVALALLGGALTSLLFALGEARQRRRAEDQADRAEEARRAAQAEAYEARLASALATLNEHQVGEAARQLRAAPEAWRGWEWYHLHSRLDDSLAALTPEHPALPAALAWPVVEVRGCPVPLLFRPWGTFLIPDDERDRIFLARTNRGALVFAQKQGEPLRWEDGTGRARQQYELPAHGQAWGVAASRDGRRLAVKSLEGAAFHTRVFDIVSARPLQVFVPTRPSTGMAFSPDGRRLAVALEYPGGAEVFDLAPGAPDPLRVQQGQSAYSVAFSPDGTQLLTCSDDRTVCQWDARTGARRHVLLGHGDSVITAVYSPDGGRIASAGRDGTVRLWSAATGEALAVLHGHSGTVDRLAFRDDGELLASGGDDGIRLWDVSVAGDPRVLRQTHYVYPVVYSPDGRWFASAGWDQLIHLWDAATGEPVAVLRGHKNWIAALAVSPDGKTLVSRGFDSTLRVWDVRTGTQQRVIEHGGIIAHGWVHQVAISPDGRLLIAGLDDRLRRWDLATGQEQAVFPLPVHGLRLAVFSPDGQRIAAVGSDDPAVWLLDARTGEVEGALRGHSDVVHAIAFSPDGTRLVSAGKDQTVRLWDAATGELQQTLRGHTDEVFAAVFHPSGSRIASAGRDRVIRIWDASSGDELVWLPGHTRYIFSLAFSPDGQTLVSGSGDMTVRLWETNPVGGRLTARREVQAVRADAERLVERLLREGQTPATIVDRVWTDPALTAPLRRAAWHAVLRRTTGGG